VQGRIVENIRGGFLVDLGVRGFLPGSLVDIKKAADMNEYIDQEVELKVIKVSRRRDNVVVSRRAVLEEEEERKHRELFERLEIGKIVKGTIKNLVDYGAFVDLGGVDGLLHISDMAWKHVVHPSDFFVQGQDVEVMVLNLDKKAGKISLGYKQKTRDPWETVEERYPKGSRVHGKVVSLKDFGAFVELENGIEGLIHISEMSWTKRIRHPNQLLKQNEKVEVQILDYDPEKRRLSLGLRQLEPNPWQEFERKHQAGEHVKGKVKSLVEFGAFVELEEGVDGLVHVSDISWTENIRHPSQALKKGQEIEAVILGMDAANGRISLGIKQLEPNAWDKFFESHKVGNMVTGRVTRLAEFGAFVELTEGVEGLVHISELADYHINKPSEVVRVGDEIDVRILRMSREERKIGLSYKKLEAAPPEAEKKERKKQETPEKAEAASEGHFRLGDLFGKALGRFTKRGS
jgi:small subunit ribosomal protein S1